MPEWVITCNGAAAPRAEHRLALNLAGPEQNFRLEIENIAAAMASEVRGRLLDVLEIASFVFAADQSIRRGGDTRGKWGLSWRRHLRFHIPVRDLEFWSKPAVRTALSAALSFLSEDVWDFTFEQADDPTPLQDYFALDPDADQAFAPDEILLFSGGADSLAGAVETLETGRRVALVSHRSAPKILKYQRELAEELRRRYRGCVLPLRVYGARFRAGDAPERTQRSRSFLYATLGFVAARMFGIRTVRFFENGVVSINLPIAEQVVGSMATRTTHPLAIRLMREFFSLVADAPIELDNPFVWKTKAEVVGALKGHGADDLVRRTVSCSNVYQMSSDRTHCGACSQCLDRRYATLAAALGEADPADIYETDLLTGPRESRHSQVMAREYTRHGLELAKMSDIAFVGKFGGELARVREGFPAMPASEVGERCFDLHRRQGAAVRQVLDQSFSRMSDRLVDLSLPPTSLLALHLAGMAGDAAPRREEASELRHLAEHPAPVEAPSALRAAEGLDLRCDEEANFVEVADYSAFRGRKAQLLLLLKHAREADDREGRPRTEFRTLTTEALADALAPEAADAIVDETAVRQLVRRIRNEFEENYAFSEGAPPPNDLLIQNVSRKGYRLHPAIRLVGAATD